MDERPMQELADTLSSQQYKIEALIDSLIEKKVFSKQEFNCTLNKVMDDSESEEITDEYVIEELKKKILLK